MIRIMDSLGRSPKDPLFDRSTAEAFSSRSLDSYRVQVHDLGNGQVEAVASRLVGWDALDWDDMALDGHLQMMDRYREEHADEIAERHAEKAAQRARKRVRLLCKAMGADTLLTLTYRANMTDLARCKANLKEFVRRLRREMPEFQAVAGFERQKRGAWHVHLATSGIPEFFMRKGPKGLRVKVRSFDLLRSVWRSVIGALGGNIDVSRRRSQGSKCARIAAYLSKYITKEYKDGDKWSNRWSKFGDCEVPQPVKLGIFPSLREALEVVYSVLMPGQVVVQSFLPRFQDFYFLSAEGELAPMPPV